MAHETQIEWTATHVDTKIVWKGEPTKVIPGATFNPWWGCQKVSRACKNCYAEHLSDVRMGNHCWGPNSTRKKFGDKHWNEPLKWNKECQKLGIKRKVFSGSMCDIFEDHPDVIEERERLFRLINATPYLNWLLLTKRPENILKMLPAHWKSPDGKTWDVPTNIWFGTTVENQEEAEKRVRPLIGVKMVTGRIIFLSMEPLMGPVDLEQNVFPDRLIRNVSEENRTKWLDVIDWVIAGGESGAPEKVDPSHPYWFISLRDQCKKYRVPFFFKQWGTFYTWSMSLTDRQPHFKMYHDYQHFKSKDWVEHGDKCVSLSGKICKIGKDFQDCEYPVAIMNPIGKKKAGRVLEGQVYNEMPA
jgi:protein gp37